MPQAAFTIYGACSDLNLATVLSSAGLLFGASDLDVSRLHALINYAEVPMIADLGSTNGTYLNRQKLPLHRACILRYGDELRLGKLVMYIYTQ